MAISSSHKGSGQLSYFVPRGNNAAIDLFHKSPPQRY